MVKLSQAAARAVVISSIVEVEESIVLLDRSAMVRGGIPDSFVAIKEAASFLNGTTKHGGYISDTNW